MRSPLSSLFLSSLPCTHYRINARRGPLWGSLRYINPKGEQSDDAD